VHAEQQLLKVGTALQFGLRRIGSDGGGGGDKDRDMDANRRIRSKMHTACNKLQVSRLLKPVSIIASSLQKQEIQPTSIRLVSP